MNEKEKPRGNGAQQKTDWTAQATVSLSVNISHRRAGVKLLSAGFLANHTHCQPRLDDSSSEANRIQSGGIRR